MRETRVSYAGKATAIKSFLGRVACARLFATQHKSEESCAAPALVDQLFLFGSFVSDSTRE
jgi:hypothetical protein